MTPYALIQTNRFQREEFDGQVIYAWDPIVLEGGIRDLKTARRKAKKVFMQITIGRVLVIKEPFIGLVPSDEDLGVFV